MAKINWQEVRGARKAVEIRYPVYKAWMKAQGYPCPDVIYFQLWYKLSEEIEKIKKEK